MDSNLTAYTPGTSKRTRKARVKVLIISDDNGFLDEVTQGFTICLPEAALTFTRLGQEGIKLSNKFLPDLIILDMSICDISAWDVLAKIRQDSQVPVIFLSYSKNEADVVKSLEMGCNTYIPKPIRQLEFMAHSRSLIKHQLCSNNAV